MKISDVKLALLEYTLPTGELYSGSRRRTNRLRTVLVKISVDQELFGISEMWYRGQDVCYLEHFLNKFLKGKDPHDIQEIKTTIRGQFDLFDEKDLGSIDVALWDIIGKLSSTPVFKLLGGYRNKIKAYLSMGSLLTAEEKERRVEEVCNYADQGFKAIKLRIGNQDVRKVLKYIEAIKENIGNEMEIMVDANQDQALGEMVWSYETALMMAKELENLGIVFLEEPLNTKRHEEIAALSQNVAIPIAGGEKEANMFGFKELIKRNIYDIVQPDVVNSGGISEVKRIANMADLYQRLCIPHCWCHGVGLAATLQAIGSIENCNYIEFPFDKSWKVPNKPGIGVEIKDEILDKINKGVKLISIE